MIKLTINKKEIECEAGKTILQIAKDNGIIIPSLCHDDRVEVYGSCGICTVEIEGSPRLIRACSTIAADGMVITTESERIGKNRKLVLELLLSDHTGDCKAPCTLACPAGTDCQGYVKSIAQGDYTEANKRIKEKIPFPASIGRVCPRPCEDACRRQLVEEPISIASLKQFIGDNVTEGSAVPQINPNTGKSVAVIGGGPAGLSAAYYLRLKGHTVTIYEAMPEMGGMLRYGIPEYRLPKNVLKREIDTIAECGVNFKTNSKSSLDDVNGKYDAVIIAIGAWSSTALRCKGEELDGVISGIDFLREPINMSGKKISVVGGGNTAMDACRTAVRMGAEKVYCIYRRTRDEMPAQDIEISEAEEEGVNFKFLTNPIEIIGEKNPMSESGMQVKSLKLQIMELGEPDTSGRRAPIAVEGKTELLEVDTVIAAIGQKAKLEGFSEIATTKWGTIVADELTFLTNINNVYAIGDSTNKGADIAVSAIGEGRRCAEVVDKFLANEDFKEFMPYIVKDEKTSEDFAHEQKQKQPRVRVLYRPASERAGDFKEVYTIFGEEEAKREAARCLECGCTAYRDRSCKLIWYANQYGANPEKVLGVKSSDKVGKTISDCDHAEIVRNPEKCVLCGLCVRVCDEVEGITALGFSGRGFDTIVKPALDKHLKDTNCNSCGKCVEICPTGAFTKII